MCILNEDNRKTSQSVRIGFPSVHLPGTTTRRHVSLHRPLPPLFTSLHTILQIRMQSSTSPEIPTQSDDETGQVLLFHNPANPHVILNLHWNPHTIGAHNGPENIEQDYKGTRETCRPVVFSDCIRISGEIQDRCRVQNRPSADPKTRRIGAQAIGTKKDTPKRTRILPFREFAIRRNPCIHFLQLRAIVAGLLFCRNQNPGPADWTRRDCTTTAEAGFEPDVNEKFEIDHRDKRNLHECTIHNQGRESICLTCSRIRTTLSNHGLWPTVMNIINNLTVTVNPTITALLPLRSWQLQSSESRHNHLILLESEHTTGRRI